MIRKVIQSNPSTLVISLPKKWVRKNNISKGDEIKVLEQDDGTLQVGGGVVKEKKIEISLASSHHQYITGLLRNLYIHGYDFVKVKFNKKSDALQISALLQHLIAFEIVEQTEEYCIIKHIANEKEEELDVFIKKVFQSILYLSKVFHESITKKDKESKQHIANVLQNTTKFSCYTRRILQKFKLTDSDEGLANYTLITLMHMVARNYWYTASYIEKEKVALEKEVPTYAKSVERHLQEVYDAYYKPAYGLNALHKRIEQLIAKADQLVQTSNSKNRAVIRHLSESSRILLTTISKIQMVRLSKLK